MAQKGGYEGGSHSLGLLEWLPIQTGLVDISVSLVSGRAVTLQMPADAKASHIKQEAAEKLGLSGEEVELVLGEDPVPDDWTAAKLGRREDPVSRSTSTQADLKLVVISSGIIALVNKLRVVVLSGSTLNELIPPLELGRTQRRSPYVVSWNPVNISQLAVRAKNLAWVYDVSAGEEIWSRPFEFNRGVQPPVAEDFEWTSDGRKLIFLHRRELIICDVVNGHEEILPQESDVSGFSLHPDGVLVAIGQTNGISLMDLETRREKDHWPIEGPLKRLLWDSSGKFLATAETSGALKICSKDGEVQWLLRQCDAAQQMGMQDSIASIAWSPVGSFVAFSSSMGTAFQVFNAQRGKMAWKSEKVGAVADFAWNYNGLKLAAGTLTGYVHIFSVQGEKLKTLDTNFGPVTSLSWSSA